MTRVSRTLWRVGRPITCCSGSGDDGDGGDGDDDDGGGDDDVINLRPFTALSSCRRFGFSKPAQQEKVGVPSRSAPSGTSPRSNVFGVSVQEDGRKASAPGLAQVAPQVSEEEELQEAEEVRRCSSSCRPRL